MGVTDFTNVILSSSTIHGSSSPRSCHARMNEGGGGDARFNSRFLVLFSVGVGVRGLYGRSAYVQTPLLNCVQYGDTRDKDVREAGTRSKL